jgi:acid phosphatase type 7
MITSSARLQRRAAHFLILLFCSYASGQQAAAPPESDTQIVLAAGDIAECPRFDGAERTAKLLDEQPGTILALGDLSYPSGTDQTFADCYARSWGRHKERTRPAPGNHEHRTPGAGGYARYFGASVGTPGHLYYSFDLGNWHLIALDSECAQIGGCQKGSPEEVWLREDLAHNSGKCILAYWHVPLFSSGDEHGNSPEMEPFWNDLHAAHADLVLNGHDHDYERFAPQNPKGQKDDKNGIREFVVGTGGAPLRHFRPALPTTEVRDSGAWGVLKLTLRHDAYEWEFLPVAGHFKDSGSGACHAAQPK